MAQDAAPTPTPAAIAEKPDVKPTEVKPAREVFLPPLSLDDALDLTRRAEALLAQPGLKRKVWEDMQQVMQVAGLSQ